VLACAGVRPVIAHQNAAIFGGDLAFVDEYDGTVESAAAGAALADRVGAATGVLLANHGAIVTGATIAEAGYKAETFERMCRVTHEAHAAGFTLRELPGAPWTDLRAELHRNAPEVFWRGAVRRLLRDRPDVLE
jgi:ribulose-5-phosphate 4-epimerase/fuculose-1-phosphate aldolase